MGRVYAWQLGHQGDIQGGDHTPSVLLLYGSMSGMGPVMDDHKLADLSPLCLLDIEPVFDGGPFSCLVYMPTD